MLKNKNDSDEEISKRFTRHQHFKKLKTRQEPIDYQHYYYDKNSSKITYKKKKLSRPNNFHSLLYC